MRRYVCIHGHFYQPPRENPWLEAIELQESAYPYHDWNERITAECYAPNARCRILGADGRINRIVNNYGRMSFNIGPTLLAWLEAHARRTYEAILEADWESRKRFGGHGSAMAQVYNHIIMPLANRRDKETQVKWGLADFRRRFGRDPEGMWLAETAADTQTLEVLTDHGIKFTVLSPYQAAAVRPVIGPEEWTDVRHGHVDPTRVYEVMLPGGKSIAVFFYDGPVSQAIAFEKVLMKGEFLIDRLMGAFNDQRDWPQLVHIATDGETYGHHHKYGDMALAFTLASLEARSDVRLTNYGEYLELHPPTWEAEILENSSWSCFHGVERWRSDCGCNSGMHGHWNQQWRGPLREAFDWLRDRLSGVFEERGKRFWDDPWAVRDDYSSVVLDRSADSRATFLHRHARRPMTPAETIEAVKLLEMQRHLLLMYTSCGWFFDELSGIETVQTIQFAARAIQLAEEVCGATLEDEFLALLEKAKSNLPDHRDGRGVYEKFVRPARVDLPKVAAHFAVSSLFEEYAEHTSLYCYSVDVLDTHESRLGRARLVTGRAKVTSDLTGEFGEFSFGAVHFGDHNLNGGVRPYYDAVAYHQLRRELEEAFRKADFAAVLRTLDRQFEAGAYSLKSLFRDEQRKLLRVLLDTSSTSIDNLFRLIHAQHALTMRFLVGLEAPLPKPFLTATEFILNEDLREAFAAEEPNLETIHRLLEEARTWKIAFDEAGLAYALRRTVARLLGRARQQPYDVPVLEKCTALVEVAETLGFDVDFWVAQNTFYEMLQAVYPKYVTRARADEASAREWLAAFTALGHKLNVAVG